MWFILLNGIYQIFLHFTFNFCKLYFTERDVGELYLVMFSLIPTPAVVIIPIWLASRLGKWVQPGERRWLCVDLLIVFCDSVHLLSSHQANATSKPRSNFSKQNIFSARVSRPFALYWDIDNHTSGNNSIDKI